MNPLIQKCEDHLVSRVSAAELSTEPGPNRSGLESGQGVATLEYSALAPSLSTEQAGPYTPSLS